MMTNHPLLLEHLNLTNSIDFNKYQQFVDGVTSDQSKDFVAYIRSLQDLHDAGCNIADLQTAADGLCAESGEFMEIVKKMVFQGKPFNEDNIWHMKREMGDIMWYMMQACRALGTTMEEIVEMNVDKLKARYPGGEFDVHYSENRKEGDL